MAKIPKVKNKVNRYAVADNTRREANGLIEQFRGGQLVPLMMVPYRQNEGGLQSTRLFFELAPIMGRLLTPPRIRITAVGAPVQALHALANPLDPNAHLTDVIRQKLLMDQILFPLEADNEIAMRAGVNPIRIANQLRISSAVRLAHNAAVNFLRLRKYYKAQLVDAANVSVTPALLGSTALERLNGVLDPDDRINGMVQLQSPAQNLRLRSTTRLHAQENWPSTSSNMNAATNGTMASRPFVPTSHTAPTDIGNEFEFADIYARLNEMTLGALSLKDFKLAELQDSLVREMDAMLKADPVRGPEAIAAWAHGLAYESHECILLAQREIVVAPNIIGATDTNGVTTDLMRSDLQAAIDMSFVVPTTELGMVVTIFAEFVPDEVLPRQPHPIFSQPWGAEKMVEQEMLLDPVPVIGRELSTDISTGNETTVYMHTGHNALKKAYQTYGLGRRLNPTTVQNKTAIWQYQIPLSVTPTSILYPANLDHYPFGSNVGDVVTVAVQSSAIIRTPMIEGPTPVEALEPLLSNIVGA